MESGHRPQSWASLSLSLSLTLSLSLSRADHDSDSLDKRSEIHTVLARASQFASLNSQVSIRSGRCPLGLEGQCRRDPRRQLRDLIVSCLQMRERRKKVSGESLLEKKKEKQAAFWNSVDFFEWLEPVSGFGRSIESSGKPRTFVRFV